MKPIYLALSLLFLAASGSSNAHANEIIGRATVIDGDTIEIHSKRIRLHGIDAPESNQSCTNADKQYRCGQQAAQYIDQLLLNKTTRCIEKDVDRYGRIVAECFVGDINVNSQMVKAGWAVAYTQYSDDYIHQESEAKASKSGIWVGSFVNPSDYRKDPTPTEIISSDGCLIKGNINSSGKKIYHLPGTTFYGRTRINVEKGERWFCTGHEAEAAGWAKALSPN